MSIISLPQTRAPQFRSPQNTMTVAMLLLTLVFTASEAKAGFFKKIFNKNSSGASASTSSDSTSSANTSSANRAEPGSSEAEELLSAEEEHRTMISSETLRKAMFITAPKRAAALEEGSTIAFVDFRHIAGFTHIKGFDDTACAAQVAAALTQHLFDLNLYQVVTRDRIENVLKEQDFSNSGSVNTTTAAELGEILGADILIYGQVQLCTSSEEGPKWESHGGAEPHSMSRDSMSRDSMSRNGAGYRGWPDAGTVATATGSTISSELGGGALATLAGGFLGSAAERWVSNKLKGNGKDEKEPPKEAARSSVLAQIQLIDASTGKQVFTTSLKGRYISDPSVQPHAMKHRELIAKAADQLADDFIDRFIARPQAQYLDLYSSRELGFDRGIELIQLGYCEEAEQHFRDLHHSMKATMAKEDVARLMYNHAVALMCSNRPQEALDRLWANLRVTYSALTTAHFELTSKAIELTRDLVDSGRIVRQEKDPLIHELRDKIEFQSFPAADSVPEVLGATDLTSPTVAGRAGR